MSPADLAARRKLVEYLLQRLESSPGELVSMWAVRIVTSAAATPMSREEVDAALLELERRGRVQLFVDDHPAALPRAGIDGIVLPRVLVCYVARVLS